MKKMSYDKVIKILTNLSEECGKYVRCAGCPFFLLKEDYCVFEFSYPREFIKHIKAEKRA